MAASRFPVLGFCLLLAGAVCLAYSNSFGGPFVLDDASSIVTNPTVRHLWPLTEPLRPPSHQGLTVEARPILNLSLALNYALGGAEVGGYHVGNLLIHLGCALLLFGILRRTFSHDLAAFAATLFWALHPLDTAAVTYVIQRAESLMALFYLLTLYCFIRFASERRGGWAVASVAACVLGMATKEVMVSAPLLVLLYDRIFVTKGWRQSLRARPGYYAALLLSGLIVVFFAWQSGGRGGTSGFGAGVVAWRYWITQPPAILHYLRLVVWPTPLVFDYGTPWITDFWAALPALGLVVLLLVFTMRMVVRGSPAGFAWAFFFLVLAPTSLVPGNRQILAEHRMYLALAGLTFAAAYLLAGAGLKSRPASFAVIVIALTFGGFTYARNFDYASAASLFGKDTRATPNNPFAWENAATAYLEAHRYGEARRAAENALQIDSHRPVAEDDLGSAWLHLGQPAKAETHFLAAIAGDPHFLAPRINRTAALSTEGRTKEAISSARETVAANPEVGAAHASLATALAVGGARSEAEAESREAIRLDPSDGQTWLNFGALLSEEGRSGEALTNLAQAVRLMPNDAQAHFDYALAFARNQQDALAEVEYRKAIGLDENYADAHENLGGILLRQGSIKAAVVEYRRAANLRSERAAFHYNLANALLQLDGRGEATYELHWALQLDPTLQPAAVLLRRLGAER